VLRARASRSETHRCRTAPWLSIAGNAGVALSSSNVELCWIFFSTAEKVRFGRPRGAQNVGTTPDGSRWEPIARVPRRFSHRAQSSGQCSSRPIQ
jgi:hypothetical protein